MKKFLKSTMTFVLAATLLTSNTGYVQAAQEQPADTITKSVVSETVFTSQATDKQQSKVVLQAKSKKKNTNKNRKAHLAYEKYIPKVKKENEVLNDPYFVYCDINKDGIDECIIIDGDYAYGEEVKNKMKTSLSSSEMGIYTYYKGKVRTVSEVFLGGNYYGLWVNLKQKCIYFSARNDEGKNETTITKKKIKNGEAKTVAVYQSIPTYKNGQEICKYTINGKKVSKKKYEKAMSHIGEPSEVTVYKVTKKNLKKFR